MNRPLTWMLVLLFTLAGRVSSADTGDWWCPRSGNWTSFSKVRVLIHPSLASELWHSDGTPWSSAELQAEIQYALESIMDLAPTAMPPLEFAGYEPSGTSFNDPVPLDAIAIRPGPECGDSSYARTATSGSKIAFAKSSVCTHRRDHWSWCDDGSSCNTTFTGVLRHELYHSLGFNHWTECNASPPACTDNLGEPDICGLMQAHGLHSEYEIEYSDYDGLVSTYGGWENDSSLRRSSSDALAWSSVGGIWNLARTFVASGWSYSTSYLSVAHHNASLDPTLYRWYPPTDAFYSWGTPYVSGAQIGQIGTAVSTYRYVSFESGQSQTDTRKFIRYSYHASSTSSSVVYPDTVMGRHGHMTAFDPRTNRLLHVWRDKKKQIMVGHSSGTDAPTAIGTLTGNEFSAAYTPSVSCGPESITYNCILAWASTGEGEHKKYLHWMHFRMVGAGAAATFDFAGFYANGYVQFGAPSVTYTGSTDASAAFVVAFKNPGRCYYTLRKSALSTSSWQNERSHCTASGTYNAPPAAGAVSGKAHSWVQANVAD